VGEDMIPTGLTEVYGDIAERSKSKTNKTKGGVMWWWLRKSVENNRKQRGSLSDV
jgi:hypothetical protein